MTLASGQVPYDVVPLMSGGRRLLGHALEFGRDPLALFRRVIARSGPRRRHGQRGGMILRDRMSSKMRVNICSVSR